jgi:mannosyltransferase OCH1-like enzyme
MSFPKIIHQTYKSFEQIPKEWKNTPKSWKLHHPSWEYRFWSDKDCENLIREHFPWFLDTYLDFPYTIQRVDSFRYACLYIYGGIYVDLDICCQKPFDKLFEVSKKVFLAESPNGDCITNALMASQPRSEFWIYCLKEIQIKHLDLEWYWLSKHWIVMNTTGPMMLDRMYNHYKILYDITLFPMNILPQECDVCSLKPCWDKTSYTSIVEGSSWIGIDTKIYTFLYCNWKWLGLIIALAIIGIVILK